MSEVQTFIQTNGHVVEAVKMAELMSNFKTANDVACITSPRPISDLKQLLNDRAKALKTSFCQACAERDELGGAELFCQIAKGEIVYDNASKDWLFYNGLYWQADRKSDIPTLAASVLSGVFYRLAAEKYKELMELKAEHGKPEAMAPEDKQAEDEAKREKEAAEHAAENFYNLRFVRNVLTFASAGEMLGVGGDEWDRQRHLLCVANAVIDLRTGKPTPPRHDQYIRTVAPVSYEPGAICPTWQEALLGIHAGDQAMIGYIQRFLGYAMSAECTEVNFDIWFGKDGQNGKEWTLEIIQAVLGSQLCGPIEPELLMKQRNERTANSASPALMVLVRRRIAWASEVNEGRTLNNAAMKDLSGGHILTGRANFGDQQEWKRMHTLILLTNHKPHVAGGGGGAEWARIRLIPFLESFVDEPDPSDAHQHKKDPTLAPKILADELPGVLNWLIEGCLAWRKNGMQTPDKVKLATTAYRKEEDTLGRYLDECCVIHVKAEIGSQAFYEHYKTWCYSNNVSPMGSKTFGEKVEDRGYKRDRKKSGVFFCGIGLAVVGLV